MSLPSFKQFISERRSNPEQNPKVSAYEYLKKYKNDPLIYISFTDVDKIGINPQSGFNTPLGIYCFPLKEIWEQYDIDKHKTLTKLPFAATRPYIWILEAYESKRFVADMYKDYTSANYDKDYRILRKIFYNKLNTWDEKKFYYLFQVIKGIKEEFIYSEYDQDIVPFYEFQNKNKEYFKLSEGTGKYGGDEYLFRHSELKNNYIDDCWMVLVSLALATRKDQNPVMGFWQLSRFLSMALSFNYGDIRMSTTWNWLLRKCGYYGFADKEGRGYIHSNEPWQAFFLSKKDFIVVDEILNKDYNTIYLKTLSDINNYISNSNGGIIQFLNCFANDSKGYLNFSVKSEEPLYILQRAPLNDFKDFINMVAKYCNSGISTYEIENIQHKLMIVVSKYYKNKTENPTEIEYFDKQIKGLKHLKFSQQEGSF
jgi:hypothetical protein